MSPNDTNASPLTIGVLALQGAFVEHECILRALGHRTVQVRTAAALSEELDGVVLPGGESTAMGLIGDGELWDALRAFVREGRPVWGTCAGMVLLAERCVGGSAVIENGQSLIGGVDVTVCRNYFGSQVSSFEMATPAPPGFTSEGSFPGVFIRAPAILNRYDEKVEVLGRVFATPCRQAAVVLRELERKIAAGEKVVMMGVVDALNRDERRRIVHDSGSTTTTEQLYDGEEEKKDGSAERLADERGIVLPGAADGSNAREVICAVRKKNVLCTAFHPELTNDHRWHEYFVNMIQTSKTDQ